jgi:hypothetical protein
MAFYEVLILLDGKVDDERINAVRHRLYDIEWECGEVLCSIVRSHQEWNSPLHQVTPFSKVIQKQGIAI